MRRACVENERGGQDGEQGGDRASGAEALHEAVEHERHQYRADALRGDEDGGAA